MRRYLCLLWRTPVGKLDPLDAMMVGFLVWPVGTLFVLAVVVAVDWLVGP